MILVVTKKLYEHNTFKDFIVIISRILGGCFERIDSSFIYKTILADILAYSQLKNKEGFHGYGLFTGLYYNYSSAELSTKVTINDTEYTIEELIKKLRTLLSELFPTTLLKSINLQKKSNILFVEDIDEFDEIINDIPKESVLKVDLIDNSIEYTLEQIKEIKDNNKYFGISSNEENLIEKIIKLISTTKDLTSEELQKICSKNKIEIEKPINADSKKQFISWANVEAVLAGH